VARAWLVTMPFAELVAAGAYALPTLPSRPLSVAIMEVVTVGLLTLLYVAIRRAPKPADVARTRPWSATCRCGRASARSSTPGRYRPAARVEPL
jgi:hypothetical protein